MTLRNLYYNYTGYPNYFDDGGIVYIQDNNGFVRPDSVQTINGDYTSGITPQNAVLNDYQLNQVNKAEKKQTSREKAQNFIDNMNGGGASGWNAIGPAAANISAAFLDTESDLADRTAAAMGMPALANIWKADWGKGNEALTDYRNKLNNIKKNNFIQDANSSWGAANAVKLNSKPIAPIIPQSQLLTWKDFRGNMFMKGAGAVAQGAASGSVGGPWGAAGGAITGLFSSLFGGIGAKKRAKSAYNSYLNKWQTLNSANQAQFNKANIDQTLSNMQALANGNTQQRINDMANIRAYGGNLYPNGGDIEPYYPESQDPTAVNWLSDWYRQRPEQMQNTFKPTGFNDYSFAVPKPNITGEYESLDEVPTDRNVNWDIRKYNDLNSYNNSLYHNLIDRAASPSIIYRMDMNPDTAGVYSAYGNYEKWKELPKETNEALLKSSKAIDFINDFKAKNNGESPKDEDYKKAGINPLDIMSGFIDQTEYGKSPNIANTISYNMRDIPAFANPDEDYYDDETLSHRIHETNHAIQSGQYGMSRGLNNIINKYKRSSEGVTPNSYLDSPHEIHSRMMQLRYETGLKPTDIITKDFIEKNKDKIKSLKLDRYTDDSLIDLLNNVADNNNMKRYSNVAAFGGGLDLSPNMINLWNNKQYIDQQKVNVQQMNFGLGNSFNQKLNTFDYGGSMNGMDLPTGMQSYENGGTHEENPYGGIQVGVDQQGNPNLVEEGEFRWGDYVFSDRINVDPTLLSRYNLAPATKHQGKKANKGKLSYADMAKKYAKKNGELANDPIGKNTLEAYMKRLQDAQEDQKFQDSMEQQKQDAINQYRKTLSTPQQGNPMYGAMKYNGMGNAATQQGVNAGMSDLGQQGSGNEVLSNTNRSGNNMLHAFGGNLYPVGGWLGRLFGRTQSNQQPSKNEWGINKSLDNVWGYEPTFEKRWEHPSIYMPNMPKYLNESLKNIGLGTYDGHIPGYDYYYTPANDEDDNNLYGDYVKSQYLRNKYLSDMGFGSTMQPAQTQQNLANLPNENNLTFEQWRDIQYGNNNSPYIMSRQEEAPDAFALQAQGRTANGSTANADYTTGYNGATNTNTGGSGLTGNINTGNTTTGTYATNAFKEDREGVPLYSTAGKFATFGKGLTPMIYDWMNKTNTKYDPKQRPANELVDMGNNSTFLRTADTIGGYRAPNLIDAERMNNAAQAQGLAALQSALSTGNGNRGFAAAQAAQNAYNTQMGIGNNYATVQQANNAERLQTDQFNNAINVANQNAINAMRQDNQRAEQLGQQMALDAKKSANDYIQKENWYADRINRAAMDNRATNQAVWTDNALNYFITQAQENAERNRQNNDITKRYWSDKNGVMHYIGDSGLNGKIREYFRKNNIDNGTFTGDRLAAFNSIIQNNKAKDVANEKGELWSTVQGLMDDEIAARQKEVADADKAKADELQEYRDQFDSELAQLGRYAANKDVYGNYWTSSGDLDYYGKEGFRDSQSLSQLKRAIEMLRTHNDRYNKWTPQNVTAYGGHINNGSKNNKNGYYTYTY